MSGIPSLRTPGSRRRAHAFAHPSRKGNIGFTLVELLVSLTILVLIMLVVASIVSQTSSIWSQTLGKESQFREARDGFESITRRLSQATLNTYWDYDNPNTPTKYIRQSELRFLALSGSLTNTGQTGLSVSPGSPGWRPTHAVFFQAPLGFVVPASVSDTNYATYQGMENLLNSWGYYVEYNSDAAFRPAFLATPSRTRFRLMEFMQSSQSLNLYSQEVAAGGNASYTISSGGIGLPGAWSWFLGTSPNDPNGINATLSGNPTIARTAPVHILAENVLGLVILPKLTPQTEGTLVTQPVVPGTALAPAYSYDSTTIGSSGSDSNVTDEGVLNSKNQLPPIVQVSMIAIDEASAIRLNAQQNQSIINELDALFTKSVNYSTDIAGGTPVGGGSAPAGGGLEPFLTSMRVNYRVFTTDVSIKGAKWSTVQTN